MADQYKKNLCHIQPLLCLSVQMIQHDGGFLLTSENYLE